MLEGKIIKREWGPNEKFGPEIRVKTDKEVWT